MVRVYTRSGDAGETSLFDGARVSKGALRVDCYGTVDELNSALSLARLATAHDDVRAIVRAIQRFLFVVGADLATPRGSAKDGIRRLDADHVRELEGHIDTYWAKLTELANFVVPGETVAAAHFHVARTICRRAERLVVTLAQADGVDAVGAEVIQYLNRLSDLLFALGRYEDEGFAAADEIDDLSA